MKKYDKYVIELIHLNGNKQIKKADNPKCYNATISLYREIKDSMYNNNVTINVVGISDSERGIIFTKKNSTTDNQRRNIKELIDVILESSTELKQQLSNIRDMVDLSNKRKNGLEHLLIEAIDTEVLTTEEKLRIFDEMRENVLTRRDYKILDGIRIDVYSDVTAIVEMITKTSNTYDSRIVKNSSIIQELIQNENTEYKDVHLIREYEYRTQKERIGLMSQLKSKYDKIINMEDKKVLACYNKCKSA